MRRSLLARLVIVILIVIVGLSLTFALDDERSLALTALPEQVAGSVRENHGLFYAYAPGAEGKLYVSEDGLAWREAAASFDSAILDVAAPDLAGDTLYVATEAGLLVTSNAGASWQPASEEIGQVVALAAEPGMNEMIYAVTGEGKLYKLTDDGRSAMPINAEGLP
ncbi:MAG: WD40/YVTN/BNR-like repeat-containing protein, partial [Ardenticatenaceae bacterium]